MFLPPSDEAQSVMASAERNEWIVQQKESDFEKVRAQKVAKAENKGAEIEAK